MNQLPRGCSLTGSCKNDPDAHGGSTSLVMEGLGGREWPSDTTSRWRVSEYGSCPTPGGWEGRVPLGLGTGARFHSANTTWQPTSLDQGLLQPETLSSKNPRTHCSIASRWPPAVVLRGGWSVQRNALNSLHFPLQPWETCFCREDAWHEKMSFFSLVAGAHGLAGAGSRRPVNAGFLRLNLHGSVSLSYAYKTHHWS